MIKAENKINQGSWKGPYSTIKQQQDFIDQNISTINILVSNNATSYIISQYWTLISHEANNLYHLTDNNNGKWSVWVNKSFETNHKMVKFSKGQNGLVVPSAMYAKEKRGFTFIRKCKQQEQMMIKEEYALIREIFCKDKINQVNWMNIYLNGQFMVQTDIQKHTSFSQWANKLILQIEGVPQYLVSFGFINNPSTNNISQAFHIDYNFAYTSIFIPMNYLVYGNSTQFFDFPFKSLPTVGGKGLIDLYGENQRQLLDHEGVDYLKVSQMISRPYIIYKLQPGSIHRGIKNSSGQDRLILWIGYSPNKFNPHTEKLITY